MAKAQEQESVEVFSADEYPQRSPEWFTLRKGLVTASNMGALMASSDERKMRRKLLYRLAGEILSDTPIETYSNAHMERGNEMEPKAIAHYAFVTGDAVTPVGFVKRTIPRQFGNIVVGASPDGLVGDAGLLQVKTMQPDLLIEFVDQKRLPTEHRWQCHAEMWVTGRKWCDLKVFYSGMPVSPVYRFERNETFISQMAEEVERFDYDLRQVVKNIRGM